MPKPTSKINWTNGNSNPSLNVVEPSGAKKIFGFFFKEQLAYNLLNWLFKNISDWIDWFDTNTDDYITIKPSIRDRYFPFTLANAANTDLTHDLKCNFSELSYSLYLRDTGTGELTKIDAESSPSVFQFTFVATPSFETTRVRVTNNSGSSRDLALVVNQIPLANSKAKGLAKYDFQKPIASQALSAWSFYDTPNDNQWNSVDWSSSLGLFCAVASSGTGTRVMTSLDGKNWTTRTSAADYTWLKVKWIPHANLFVAIASAGGTTDKIMTSANGTGWNLRTTSNQSYVDLTFSKRLSLIVAVANTGTPTQAVLTSADGLTWVARANYNPNIQAVAYSEKLNLFVSTGYNNDGMGSYFIGVETSSDGITWTSQIPIGTGSGSDLTIQSLIFSDELNIFILSASNGTNTYISISQDGINFTEVKTFTNMVIKSLCFSPNLGAIVAIAGSEFENINKVVYSFDATNWISTSVSKFGNNSSICWSKDLNLFCAVSSYAPGLVYPNAQVMLNVSTQIGEYVTSGNIAGTTMSVSGTVYNLSSIVLSKGQWIIFAKARSQAAGTSYSVFQASISATSATHDTKTLVADTSTQNTDKYISPMPSFVSVTSASQTFYLTVSANFTGTAPIAQGGSSNFYALKING